MRKLALLAPLVLLSACGAKRTIVTELPPVVVKEAVAQPCAKPRPAPVTSLKDVIGRDVWQAMDIAQKAAQVGLQADARQTYGEQLHAATGACPEVK